MDLKRIEAIAFQEMGGRKELKTREPGWLFYHGLRTARIAEQLREALGDDVNRDVLFAGALFHDIGKGTDPHNEHGAEVTRRLLAGECSEAELAPICEIVRLHNQRRDAKSHPVPVRIVQDADNLDHVGPIVAWLAFYWSGTRNETAEEHVQFASGDENAKYREAMRSYLNFDVSRRLFDERVRWEDEFFGTFRKVYFEGVFPV
jgi:uncharacterized protein